MRLGTCNDDGMQRAQTAVWTRTRKHAYLAFRHELTAFHCLCISIGAGGLCDDCRLQDCVVLYWVGIVVLRNVGHVFGWVSSVTTAVSDMVPVCVLQLLQVLQHKLLWPAISRSSSSHSMRQYGQLPVKEMHGQPNTQPMDLIIVM